MSWKVIDKLTHLKTEESYVHEVNDHLFAILKLQHEHLQYLHEMLDKVPIEQ